MSTRIYRVQSDTQFHLVEASTPAAALRFIAQNVYEVSVVDQKTLVAAIKDGIEVQVAGEAPKQAEAPKGDAK